MEIAGSPFPNFIDRRIFLVIFSAVDVLLASHFRQRAGRRCKSLRRGTAQQVRLWLGLAQFQLKCAALFSVPHWRVAMMTRSGGPRLAVAERAAVAIRPPVALRGKAGGSSAI